MEQFTMEQFKQLSTALTKFGEYEEWKDTFEDIFHCYKYGTDEIQVKYTFDTYAGMYTKTRSISVELYPEEGWRTVTIIEAGPEKANMYGKVYSFDELMSLLPSDDYDESEWLDML